MLRMILAGLLLQIASAAATADAITVNINVPGTSNPFLAGMPNGSTASMTDSAPGQSPVGVPGPILDSTIPLVFSATGMVDHGPNVANGHGPDGGAQFGAHHLGAENGISDYVAPENSLLGVFLSDERPDISPAPSRLDFSISGNVVGGVDYLTLNPVLKQVFFVGDGRTSAGIPQRVFVPAGATRLFLAVKDGTGWYNNSGSFDVAVTSCTPGDTDDDGDIDTGDLTTAIVNYTGPVGTGKTCADGDTDYDGDVDSNDLTNSIINFTGAQAGNPNVPDLIYDPATGNVTIDSDGADLISFSLQAGPFNAADFSDLPAGLTDNIANQIGWTSFNLFTGLTTTANLGAILPAGLDEAQLLAALQTASYGLALSGGGGGGRFDVIIPEPALLMLMGLGATALVPRRRAA